MYTDLGQSEDKGIVEKEKIHKVPWHVLNLETNDIEQKILGRLAMPTNLPAKEGNCAPVTLDMHTENQDSIHALTIMRDSDGNNILHARLVMEDESTLLAWVEPYTGNLMDYLSSTNLGVSESATVAAPIVLPTFTVYSAISQIIDGIEQLRVSGHYHGNFSLVNTYYIMDMDSGALKVKLANFRKKEGSFKQCLAQDWSAVADGLKEICKIAETLNKGSNSFPYLECCQLNGLTDMLKNIALRDVESAHEGIKHHPFFWGKEERKRFFICDIPLALRNKEFLSKVEGADFISLPWGKDGFCGFILQMNIHRSTKGKEKYDNTSRKDFVHFISSLYSYESKLKAVKKVDASVQMRYPCLCYQLYALLSDAEAMGT